MFFRSLSFATLYPSSVKSGNSLFIIFLIFDSNSSISFALYTFLPSSNHPSNIGISLIIDGVLQAHASIIGIPSVSSRSRICPGSFPTASSTASATPASPEIIPYPFPSSKKTADGAAAQRSADPPKRPRCP